METDGHFCVTIVSWRNSVTANGNCITMNTFLGKKYMQIGGNSLGCYMGDFGLNNLWRGVVDIKAIMSEMVVDNHLMALMECLLKL